MTGWAHIDKNACTHMYLTEVFILNVFASMGTQSKKRGDYWLRLHRWKQGS